MTPIIVPLIEIVVLSFMLTGVLLLVLLKLRVLPGLERGESLYSMFRLLVRKQEEEKPQIDVRDSLALGPFAAALLIPMYLSSPASSQARYVDITMISSTIRVVDKTQPSPHSAPNLIVPLPA
jgi:hypothetical protein